MNQKLGGDGILTIDDFYVCQCSWSGHTLRWQLVRWDWDELPEVSVHINLDHHLSFWRRLLEAFKYIFKMRSSSPHFDDWIMDERDLDRLTEFLKRFKLVSSISKKRAALKEAAERTREKSNRSCEA